MMSEANEEVTEKYQNLFEGCNFRFKGLKSEIEKAFVNLVEDLGAEVSVDAQVTFVQKCYFLKKKNTKKRNLYDIGYIMDSVQAGKAISLDNYRFVPHDNDEHSNDEPMCYAARYIYKTDSCHKCFYDKVFCIECAKQNKESQIPSNRHQIVIASDSSFESENEMSESPSLILRKKDRDNEKVMQHGNKSKKRIISSASDHSDGEEQSTSTRKCLSKKRFKISGKTVDRNEFSETEVENERYKRDSDSKNDSYETNSEKPRKVVSEINIVKRKKLGDDTSDAESNRNKNFKEVRNGNCGSPLNKRSPKKVVETNIVGEIESENDMSNAESNKLKGVKKSRNEERGSRLNKRSPKKVVERNVVSEKDSDDDISDVESIKNKHVKIQRNENCGNKSNKRSPKKVVERNIVRETDSNEDISDAESSKNKHFKVQRNENYGNKSNKKSPKKVFERNIVRETDSDENTSDAERSRAKHDKVQRNGNCRNGHNEKKATEIVLENDIVSKTESDDDLSDAETHKNKNLHKKVKKSSEWIKASTSKTLPAKMKQHLKASPDSDVSVDTEDEEKLYFKEKKWWLNHEISKEEECKILCCSYEPGPHRKHWPARRFLSLVEKKILVKYLIITNNIQKAKGNTVYENMRKEGYLAHRSVESLRNCFRRTIVKEMDNYRLPAEIYKKFVPMIPREQRKMKFKKEEEDDDD